MKALVDQAAESDSAPAWQRCQAPTPRRDEEVKKKVDPAKIAFLVSTTGLVFLAGFFAGVFHLFPYGILNFGYDSLREVWEHRETVVLQRPEDFLEPARHPGEGVTHLLEARMAPGLTLLAGFFGDTNELRLVTADGEPVRRWPVKVTEIFQDLSHIQPPAFRPENDWGTDIHGALALPDGSVVFNFEYMGMVKLDRCGDVVWTLPRMTHHSIHPGKDGSFWVGGRSFVAGPSRYPPLSAPYHEDLLLRVSSQGEVLEEISVPGLFFKNDLHYLPLANGQFEVSARPDLEIVHLNDVEELSPDMAEAFPSFRPGDLILSMRHLNLLMVVDPETETVRWHQTGPYIRQHDPDFRSDGKITVFDNNTDGSRGELFGGSRILEIDPVTGEVAVLYGDREEQAMYTRVRGKSQNLQNGNLLIVEALAGRVFEVAPDGILVWEFINRFDEDEVARISDAVRYSPDYFQVESWSCSQ